jgi:TonB-dependent SusC/RagA subfamily outer membrane receptor
MITKIFLFSLLSVLSFAASQGQKSNNKLTITGVVLDKNQKPISGAIIFIDNKKSNIFTDKKGFYRIKVRSSAKQISAFTLMNGLSETPIDGRTTINFTMKAAGSQTNDATKNQSNEETVNIGYGAVKKKDLTMQVGKIDGTNKKYAAYKDIYEMIHGELPGVQVNGNKIVIQGPSSITSSTDPLLVVDGMVVGSIDGISPQQVKSIEVLKGAAASIYGSRGANGVILIYLRNGTEKDR